MTTELRQNTDWSKLSSDATDRAFVESVTAWPRGSAAATPGDGIDYEPVVRDLLWWRAARVIRQIRSPELADRENQLLSSAQGGLPRTSVWFRRLRSSGRLLASALRQRFRTDARRRLHFDAPGAAGGCSFAPVFHRRWKRTGNVLKEVLPNLVIGMPHHYARFAPFRSASTDFGCHLTRLIDDGFQKHGITLSERDLRELNTEIARRHLLVTRISGWLQRRSGMVVVANDSDSPNVETLAVAQALQLPSLMIQHGLDCERFVLDRTSATHIAVWGQERCLRYAAASNPSIRHLRIVGNPEYDEVQRPGRLVTDGGFWLWVTRPHAPGKCLLPSRSPLEGLHILESLLQSLKRHPDARLVVKPHRHDNVQMYVNRLADSSVRHRVTISCLDPDKLFPSASVIMTEDTTAALEAMFHAKPLIHVYSAATPPVLPLVSMKAALPGHDSESLADSLRKLSRLTQAGRRAMDNGQKEFIDLYHPLRGNATQRLKCLVTDSLAKA